MNRFSGKTYFYTIASRFPRPSPSSPVRSPPPSRAASRPTSSATRSWAPTRSVFTFHFSAPRTVKDRIYVYIPILFDSVRSPWINNLCRPTVERRRWARLGCGPDGADAVVVRPAGPVQGRHHHFHFGRRCLRSRLSRARVAEQRPRPRFVLGPGMIMMLFSATNPDVMIKLSSPYCPASLAIGEIPTIGYKVKTSRRTQCAE